MANTEISLGRILDLRVPVAWHEAVAVAQTVAQAAGDYARPLGPDNCVLTNDGSLQIYSESSRPFRQDPGAGALSALLDKAHAPNELAALCAHYEAGDHAARDFAGEIAFFARPDTAGSIAALVTRALAVEAETAGRSAFEQLRNEVAQATPAAPRVQTTARQRKGLLIGAGVTAAAAAMTTLIVLTPEGSPAQVADTTTTALQTATASIDKLLDAGFTSIGLRAAAEAAPPPVADAASSRPAPRKNAPVATGASVNTTAATVTTTKSPGAELAAEATMVSVTPVEPVDLGVYGPEHTAVDPPVLVRPQLPRPLGGPPPADSVHLEVMINPMGTVDAVHLRGAPSTFHDRMLLSAAKAWIFRPAYKDGQPVSYALRVAVTP